MYCFSPTAPRVCIGVHVQSRVKMQHHSSTAKFLCKLRDAWLLCELGWWVLSEVLKIIFDVELFSLLIFMDFCLFHLE